MKKNKVKKIFLLSIFLTLTTVINIDKVVALERPDFGGSHSDFPINSAIDNKNKTKGINTGDTNRKATCEYTKSGSSYSWVYIKGYGIDNITNIEQEFLAGTYIGLNIYETKGYTMTGSVIKVTAKEKKIKCNYDRPYRATSCGATHTNSVNSETALNTLEASASITSNIIQLKPILPELPETPEQPESPSKPTPTPSLKDCHEKWSEIIETDETCSPTYLVNSEEIWEDTEPNSLEKNACEEIAKPNHSTLYPSYEVSYRDSNDIETMTGGTSYIARGGTDEENCIASGEGFSISKTCTFSYNREKTCMNVKTGKVYYINSSKNCDSNNDITVTEISGYWKYFIPLNASSTGGFSFSMNPSNSNITRSEICEQIIDTTTNYQNFIKPVGEEFVAGESNAKAKKKVSSGCIYQTKITIPITQEFYNELPNGKIFKGFNFYYKPIDTTNPFPNGLTDTSLWYDWYKSTDKNPDLTKSYNKVTYYAQFSNANKIREYTKDNPYTSWSNMYASGVSSFIEKEGVITRYVDKNSFYKLGCGPANSNVTNAFQQKECDG